MSGGYEELPALSGVYLEDSYVLAIELSQRDLVIELDAVLTPAHPAYRDPRPDEQYCFRRARIRVRDAESMRWVTQTMQPFRDATGEADYGSIDTWQIEDDVSRLTGEWGEIEFVDGVVTFEVT